MKIHKIVLFVVDYDELGADEVRSVIENEDYPNHCLVPKIQSVETRDVGEWGDNHPLNNNLTFAKEVKRIFG